MTHSAVPVSGTMPRTEARACVALEWRSWQLGVCASMWLSGTLRSGVSGVTGGSVGLIGGGVAGWSLQHDWSGIFILYSFVCASDLLDMKGRKVIEESTRPGFLLE